MRYTNPSGILRYKRITLFRPDRQREREGGREGGNLLIVDFAVPADHRVKLKESKKKDKYLDLVRELKKKLWDMKVTVIPIVIGVLGTVTKGLVQGLGNKRASGDQPNYSIAEISQNTKNSPGDLLSLKLQLETIG